MPEKQTVAAMWDEFAGKVVPAAAAVTQRSEMRLAFYAGALVTFNATFQLDPGDEPTDADLAYMDALYTEINAFLMDQIGSRLGTGWGQA